MVVILVLALHVAIPDHQCCHHLDDHLGEDDGDLDDGDEDTCPLEVLSAPALLQVQSPDKTSRLIGVIIIVSIKNFMIIKITRAIMITMAVMIIVMIEFFFYISL